MADRDFPILLTVCDLAAVEMTIYKLPLALDLRQARNHIPNLCIPPMGFEDLIEGSRGYLDAAHLAAIMKVGVT